MKVLVSAYACSPYHGSEPGVGWGFVKALAELHELCVITELASQAPINRYLQEHPEWNGRVRFEYIPRVRYRLLERLWPPSYYWTYRKWQKNAYLLAQQMHAQSEFDLVHQLTMVGFREPGYMWKLGVPFVWGPVGGLGYFPWRFVSTIGGYGALYYLSYNLYNWWQTNFFSRPKLAAKAATVGLIAVTPGNRDDMLRCWGCGSTVLSEVGLPRDPVQRIRERADGTPLRLVWVGGHTPGKALNLGLAALGRLPADIQWTLDVLGKGRRTAAWQRSAKRLKIDHRCHFHGWVPREHALQIMQDAHVMLITSLRDLTATVTVEALALGLPIICLDHCGFAEAVNETCGIKIPVSTPNEVIAAMARAIEHLARNENRRQALARGALRRASLYRWEDKAETVTGIYLNKFVRRQNDVSNTRRGSTAKSHHRS